MKRYQMTRRFLIFWTLFIGIGAVGGVCAMLYDPTGAFMGMDVVLPYFQILPFADILFQNFVFSGISLLVVNGISNLTAAVLLFRKKPLGIKLGGIFGCTLMAWICIQFYMFEPNTIDTAYFLFGLAQALTGYACWVFYRQVSWKAETVDYPHIGQNPKTLVVYFSRLGRVKRLACEEAERTGGVLFEVRTTERTRDTLGFWWCGRFGMHQWAMPIEEMPDHLEQYETVILCTPVWVFTLCGPMREFCRRGAGKIHRAEYVVVHFQPWPSAGVCREMDRLLGITAEQRTDVRCQLGHYKVLHQEAARQDCSEEEPSMVEKK